MEQSINNQQKNENYREQQKRLDRALKEQFFLEAIFIEYAILEDRLEAILRHAGRWRTDRTKYVSIDAKVKKVAKLAEEKTNPAHKYFPPELMNAVLEWKEKRNRLIHALLKQELHTEDLLELAEDGRKLTRQMCSKATSHRRVLERIKNQAQVPEQVKHGQ